MILTIDTTEGVRFLASLTVQERQAKLTQMPSLLILVRKPWDVDRYTDVIMTPMDPTKRIVRGVWGVACTDGATRVLPNNYRVTVDRWMPETNGAQISVLWPPLDGIQVRITACVGAEDLALHTYPAPPPEG